MSLYPSDDQASERWHLLRKLILLFLIVVALVMGLVLLSRQKPSTFPFQLFNILADVSVGVAAGVGARFVLRQRNGLIQGLAATAVTLVGLAVLGGFTDWKSGLNLQHFAPPYLSWSSLFGLIGSGDWEGAGALFFGHSRFDLLSVANLAIAVDAAWIALRAWTTSSVSSSSVAPAAYAAPHVRSRSHTVSAPAAMPHMRVPSVVANAGPRVKRRKLDRPILASAAAPAPGRGARPARFGGHKREVQLAVYEEHKCPYCFEVVKRNDPRGVVECEVCHTLHHKDCWDVTGSCQVPHLNT
jgi:hypothetical protein